MKEEFNLKCLFSAYFTASSRADRYESTQTCHELPYSTFQSRVRWGARGQVGYAKTDVELSRSGQDQHKL